MPKPSKNYSDLSIEEKKKLHRNGLVACGVGPLGILYFLFIEGYARRGNHYIFMAVAGFVLAIFVAWFHLKKLNEMR